MTQTATHHPSANPEMAAQEALVALINAGAFGNGAHGLIQNESRAESVAKALVEVHTRLTAYYRTLPGAQ